MNTPLDIFGQELLNSLGAGPRKPYYHIEGKEPEFNECIDYGFMCYKATRNGKPNAPLEIQITIKEFLSNSSILNDLLEVETERKIFVIERKYLWVIDENYDLQVLPERTQNPMTDRGYVCHTNITAGKSARHGGELWYGLDGIIFINNSSGRYYTKDAEEWKAVIKIFSKAGYKKVVDIDLKKNNEPVTYE